MHVAAMALTFAAYAAPAGWERADMEEAWTSFVAGALTFADFTDALRDSGFVDLQITPTHRVHAHASSAIVRARRA